MKKALISVLFLGLMVIMATSCKKDPVSVDDDDDNKTDTSIFKGTWYEIFDTSDVPPGTKDEKIMYWFMGGTQKDPSEMTFENDTVIKTGAFEYNYFYTNDSIVIYQNLNGSKYIENVIGYEHWGEDSLYLNPKDSGYNPLNVRN